MEQARKVKFKELHTKLLIKVAKEFEKHGFAPSPIQITFDTEEYIGDSTIKPQTVHLYDVREIK